MNEGRSARARRTAMIAAIGVASIETTASPAWADAHDVGCKGCLVTGESTTEPRPLVVLLHGDGESPVKILAAWKAAAKEKNVTLYAPRCPRDAGCTAGSYWRWGGPVSWVEERVADVEARFEIDPDRRYLAGWSGGATYATMNAHLWPASFASVSLAGGGSPGASCSPIVASAGKACSPIHYLTGTRNPLHHLAVSARDQLVGCGFDVTWDERQGLDHAGEWRAYTKDVPAILDRLLAARRTSCIGAPTSEETAPETAPPAAAQSVNEPPPAAPAPIPPKKSCACRVGARDESSIGGAVLALLGGVVIVARRHARAWRARPKSAVARTSSGI